MALLREVARLSSPPDSPARYSTPLPEPKLHCSSAKCGGAFWFKVSEGSFDDDLIRLAVGEAENRFIEYICKSCDETRKIYAVWFGFPAQGKLLAYKFGEHPDYGPPLPATVLRLVQSDADLFTKGWKAEKMGFGICAFTYYRRIVERHKTELFDKFIEIAEDEHVPTERAGRPKANGRVLLTVRVEPDLRQRLEAKAVAEKCSLTELVERLLKTALEDAHG